MKKRDKLLAILAMLFLIVSALCADTPGQEYKLIFDLSGSLEEHFHQEIWSNDTWITPQTDPVTIDQHIYNVGVYKPFIRHSIITNNTNFSYDFTITATKLSLDGDPSVFLPYSLKLERGGMYLDTLEFKAGDPSDSHSYDFTFSHTGQTQSSYEILTSLLKLDQMEVAKARAGNYFAKIYLTIRSNK